MDIMELGAIGELVGGVAVIGSLLFVGIQLRSTTKTLRAQSTYEAIIRTGELNHALFTDPKLATLASNFEDGGAVDVDEPTMAQFRYFARGVFLQWSAQQFLHQEGMLEDAYWKRNLEYARGVIETEFGAAWWAKDQQVAAYPPEFVRLVNSKEA